MSAEDLAMRAEPHQFQPADFRLAVNLDQVGPDMAVTVVRPLAAQRMITAARRQRLIVEQQRQ
jgi:hypothetical protein